MHSLSFEKKYCPLQRNIWKHSSPVTTHWAHLMKVFSFLHVTLPLRACLNSDSSENMGRSIASWLGVGSRLRYRGSRDYDPMAQSEHNFMPTWLYIRNLISSKEPTGPAKQRNGVKGNYSERQQLSMGSGSQDDF